MRAIGIDVGEQRVGVAVSDPTGLLSTPHSIVARTPRAPAEITALATSLEAETIVVGLPLKMRGGGEGSQAAVVRAFAEELRGHTSLPIEFYDERLTTVMAERAAREQGGRRDRRKQHLDAVAAALILDGWLQRRRARARDT